MKKQLLLGLVLLGFAGVAKAATPTPTRGPIKGEFQARRVCPGVCFNAYGSMATYAGTYRNVPGTQTANCMCNL